RSECTIDSGPEVGHDREVIVRIAGNDGLVGVLLGYSPNRNDGDPVVPGNPVLRLDHTPNNKGALHRWPDTQAHVDGRILTLLTGDPDHFGHLVMSEISGFTVVNMSPRHVPGAGDMDMLRVGKAGPLGWSPFDVDPVVIACNHRCVGRDIKAV